MLKCNYFIISVGMEIEFGQSNYTTKMALFFVLSTFCKSFPSFSRSDPVYYIVIKIIILI